MPQLRTFSGFASTPGIGSAIVGGAGVAQRARESAAQASNERARISSAYAIAEMETRRRQEALVQELQFKQQEMQQEMQIKQQSLEQQAFKDAQELEVQKAYHTAQIGLKERDVKVAEQKQQQEMAQVAEKTKSRLNMQRDVEQLLAAGVKPQEAYREVIMRHGPTADLPGSAWSDVIESGGGGAQFSNPDAAIGTMSPVEGQPGWRMGRTGPNSAQFIPPDKQATVPEEVSFDPSLIKAGTRYLTKPAATEANKLEKEALALKKQLRSADFELHRRSVIKSKDPKAELSVGDKARIAEVNQRQKEIDELEARISQLRGSLTNSPVLPSPGNSTNRVGRFEIIR